MSKYAPILDAHCQRTLLELQTALEGEINSLAPQLLIHYPIRCHTEHFDRYDLNHGYHVVPPEVAQSDASIVQKYDTRAGELYSQLLFTRLLQDCDARARRRVLTASVVELLRIELRRIVTELQVDRAGFYSYQNELFVKDLALCRIKLVPCGSEHVDISSGIPRRILFGDGPRQFTACSWFVLRKLGGFKPLYETHWDRRLVTQFSEVAYNACYVRIAEMLRMNQDVRGIQGASWWFDPVVRRITPELEFLSRTPQEHGAQIFRVGPHPHATRDATAFSPRRKALYKSGEYKPERYMLIWSRDDLLDWAEGRTA